MCAVKTRSTPLLIEDNKSQIYRTAEDEARRRIHAATKSFVVTNALVVKPINDLAESPFTTDLEVKTIVVGWKEASKWTTFI